MAIVMEDSQVFLPGHWRELLERGQLFTALLLSTSYSEQLGDGSQISSL